MMSLPAEPAAAMPSQISQRPAKSVSKYLGGDEAASQAKNTFYAYAEAGESVEVAFSRADKAKEDSDATIRVTAPDGAEASACTLKVSAKKGQTCRFEELTSDESGVWTISHLADGDGNGTVAYWDIQVMDGTSARKGRVWTDSYNIYQKSADSTDLNLFYLSEFGYLYQAKFRGYNGRWSELAATAAGLTHKDSCTPINRSAAMKGDFSADLSRCGVYKVFFEHPDSALPAEASLPGGDEVWLLSPVVEPELGPPTYAPKEPHEIPGVFSVPVTNHNGTITIHLDLNHNGSFDDKVDRDIRQGITASGTQNVEVAWDGLDGRGKRTKFESKLNVKASLDQAGAIYFVTADVEGRSGGIEVTHLNGPEESSQKIYWNDTFEPGDASANSIAKADEHIDSSGGARSWDLGDYSWGDNRRIQEWTYVPADEESTETEATLPTRRPKTKTDVADGSMLPFAGPEQWVVFAGLGTMLAGLVGLGILAQWDRRRQRIRL